MSSHPCECSLWQSQSRQVHPHPTHTAQMFILVLPSKASGGTTHAWRTLFSCYAVVDTTLDGPKEDAGAGARDGSDTYPVDWTVKTGIKCAHC